MKILDLHLANALGSDLQTLGITYISLQLIPQVGGRKEDCLEKPTKIHVYSIKERSPRDQGLPYNTN